MIEHPEDAEPLIGGIRAPRIKRRLRNWWVAPAAVVVLVALILGSAYACVDRPPFWIFGAAPYPGGMPIPLEQAKATYPFPIAEFPEIRVEDACTKKTAPLKLLEALGGTKDLILVYSHGLWLRQTTRPRYASLNMYNRSKSFERTVRGHAAQVTPRGWDYKPFFCGSGFACDDFWTSDVPGSKYYSRGAEIRWIENGVRYALQGPFTHEQLIELAEQLTLANRST